jgi:hypothetical protein
VPFWPLFHLPGSDLQFGRYSLSGSGKGPILSEISGYSIATQRILVRSRISHPEVKEQVELHNLHTDHVMIRSELKYLIGVKVVLLDCWVFSGNSGPFLVGRVFRVVRPVATVRVRVSPESEPTREIGPGVNTTDAMASAGESLMHALRTEKQDAQQHLAHRMIQIAKLWTMMRW